MVLFAGAFGAGLGWLTASTINVKNTENFTEFNPSLPTKLLDINGELITEFSSDEKREMIDVIDLPQNLIDALLTREDRIFYEHKGFSFKSILRAVVGKVLNQSLGGGSTLTQQIAGTLYCDRTDISISRKIKELWWAIQMERRYSKQEILGLYLNKVYLGAGTYGVDAASKHYFGHGATEITPAEAAILVIQLSNPSYYNPFEHPNRAKERQLDVLGSMVENGYLTQAEADASFDDYWVNFDFTRTNSSAYSMREDAAPWFSEYVLREMNSMLYGTMDVYTDGYTINTTLNLNHQEVADRVMKYYINYANESYQSSSSVRKSDAANTYIPLTELISLVFNIPELKLSEQRNEAVSLSTYQNEINPVLDIMSLMFGLDDLRLGVVSKVNAQEKEKTGTKLIEGTMIALENSTGYITSLVGGSTFDQDNQFIRATQATLQPGSTFKPLYYSAAIDSRKFTEATIIYDSPVVFKNLDGTPYIPENFKGTWEGSVQLWYALATSMNVPSLKVLDNLGFEAAIDRATALLGIPYSEREERSFIPVYPLGLGVVTVQPIQMARAFAIFANQGKEVTPMAIRTVEDRNGNVILSPEKEIRESQLAKGDDAQIISPQTAYIMCDLLQNTVSMGTLYRGSGWGSKFRYTDENGKRFTMPMAGKTGTTQNWADAWTVGFSPYYTAAFWFGFDKKGQTLGLELTGATLAGVAWGDYMGEIHEGLPYKTYTKPQTGLVEATVCSVSGMLPTAECGNHVSKKVFLEGTEPTTFCEFHTNRVTAQAIGQERLEHELLQTGYVFTEPSKPELVLDLSFLEEKEPEDSEDITSSIIYNPYMPGSQSTQTSGRQGSSSASQGSTSSGSSGSSRTGTKPAAGTSTGTGSVSGTSPFTTEEEESDGLPLYNYLLD